MNIYEKDFVIEYVDVDTDGLLSDWGFFKFLQEIGCLHADKLGFGFNDIPKTGLAWILLDWKLQIFKRPIWKDKIHIRTWPSKIDLACCFRDYEIFDEAGNKLAIATSRWVLYNLPKKRISKITPEVAAAFSSEETPVFNEEIQKLHEPEGVDASFEYKILKKDIDSNHHVNNLNYINFAREVLPDDVFSNVRFSQIEVMYKKQCLLGDEIVCLYKRVSEREHVVTIKSKDLKNLHAIVRFTL